MKTFLALSIILASASTAFAQDDVDQLKREQQRQMKEMEERQKAEREKMNRAFEEKMQRMMEERKRNEKRGDEKKYDEKKTDEKRVEEKRVEKREGDKRPDEFGQAMEKISRAIMELQEQVNRLRKDLDGMRGGGDKREPNQRDFRDVPDKREPPPRGDQKFGPDMLREMLKEKGMDREQMQKFFEDCLRGLRDGKDGKDGRDEPRKEEPKKKKPQPQDEKREY